MPAPVTALQYGSYQYLMRQVQMALHWGNNDALLTNDKAYEVNEIVQRGVRRFYNPPKVGNRQHRWSFLRPVAEMTLTASYTTGTVTVVSGVVTLAGGTWPSTAADGEIAVGGGLYTVATRDSDTQVTLDDTSVNADAGTSYSLGYYRYDLPTDFVDFYGPITYTPGNSAWYNPIELVSEYQIRLRRQSIDQFGYPTIAAYRTKALSATAGTTYEILFWPIPEDAFVLNYRYEAFPDDLSTTNLWPAGGKQHANTWTEAVLAEAEASRFGDQSNRHEKRFLECLSSSIDHDQKVNAPEFLGKNSDRSDYAHTDNPLEWTHRASVNVVTYTPGPPT